MTAPRFLHATLLACSMLIAVSSSALATVRPPDEWFDSVDKQRQWTYMLPKLVNWEFKQQPALTGPAEESLASIRRHFGQSSAEANQARGLSADDPARVRADLNLDGRIDQYDVLELGFQRAPGHKRASTAPSTGTNKWVVLRADFPDQAANYAKYTQGYFNDYLFSDGTFAKQSCNDYFKQVSYGKLSISGIVSGSGSGGDGWHMAQNNKAYYINNGGNLLVREAVLAADAEIDFSQYDVDGDGYTDTVMLFYPNAVFSNGLWPHRSSGLNIQVDGVIVDSYFITGTNDSDESWTMTITSHEYGHILGLPDLYDVNGGSAGLGRWSLMAYQYDSNHKVPSPDPWCKTMLGWVTPKNITENIAGYSLPDYQNNPEVLRLWTDGIKGDQYFLLTNHRQVLTDTGRPGQGLMIWHIDDSIGGSNNDNANELRKHVDVESARGMDNPAIAGGTDPLDREEDNGHAQDPFFAGNAAAAYTGVFDNASNPRSNNYPAPGSNTSVRVSNISASAANMTFDIQVRSPNAPTVTLTSPLSGTQSGNVTVTATATPAGGRSINRVEFYCNDALLGSDNSSPYSLVFDSRCIFNGNRELKAVAVDSAGSIDSDSVTLPFSNSGVALPYAEGFESGIGSCAAYNPSGDRFWTSMTIAAVGSRSAAIGSTTAGYDYNEHDTLCTVRLDLSSVAHPIARWRQRYRVASGENTVSVWISTDDGATRTQLASWTGSALSWQQQAVDLLPYAGQQAYLLFRLDSSSLNRSTGDAGFWIDELEVRQISAPPSLLGISPGDGSLLSGEQIITVDASDDVAVLRVDFKLNGSDLLFTDLAPPFSFNWNSDWVFDAAHSFTATAYDADSQSASATVNWTTSNAGLTLPYTEDFPAAPSSAWRIINQSGAGFWKHRPTGGFGSSGGMYMGINTTHDNNESDWLISPTFSVTASDNWLGFLHRYDIEAGYDYGRVFATTNLNSWSELGVFSATNVPYAPYSATLAGYSGQKIKLAWYFSSDVGLVEEGWYVDEVRVRPRPLISGHTPEPAVNGAQLTLTGSGFGDGLAHDFPQVSISGQAATIVSWSDNEVVVTVPATAASGNAVLTCHGIPSLPYPVKVKLPPPVIDNLGNL